MVLAWERAYLAFPAWSLLRGFAVSQLSRGSRVPPFADRWLYVGVSCNVMEKPAYLAPAGSWPLRGVAVALPSWDSCISPTVGQWNCGAYLVHYDANRLL